MLLGTYAHAYRSLKNTFMQVYPIAVNSILDDVPSNNDHCGVCHFDFDGGGGRTPYGEAVKLARDSGSYPTDFAAITAIGVDDSDTDGYSNDIEITDLGAYSNTPTFPGLTATNVGSVSNVNAADLSGRLTPIPGNPVEPSTWGRIKALYASR
jgi:hypothetical protein